MAIIMISPAVPSETEPSEEVVQLQITVVPEDYEGLFDAIQIWRSTAGVGGPYEEITDEGWGSARVPRTGGDASASPGESVALVDKRLELQVNEEDLVTTIFTGTDPLTFAQAAAQVIAQSSGRVLAHVDESGVFVVETTQPGSGASLRVLESDGAAILGLPTVEPSCLSFGREARIQLQPDQQQYIFKDLRGSDAYFYRTRFFNSISGTFSEFSAPFSVGAAPGLLPDHLVVGRLELVGLNGKPLTGVKVTVYNAFQSSLVDGRLVAESRLSQVTDDGGLVEFTLVRGTKVTAAISNTDIVRDILVPVDASIGLFSLLDPSVSTGPDVFKVQVPTIVAAERRTP